MVEQLCCLSLPNMMMDIDKTLFAVWVLSVRILSCSGVWGDTMPGETRTGPGGVILWWRGDHLRTRDQGRLMSQHCMATTDGDSDNLWQYLVNNTPIISLLTSVWSMLVHLSTLSEIDTRVKHVIFRIDNIVQTSSNIEENMDEWDINIVWGLHCRELSSQGFIMNSDI